VRIFLHRVPAKVTPLDLVHLDESDVKQILSFTLGELSETTGMPLYYMDEDYPAGPGIIEPLPE